MRLRAGTPHPDVPLVYTAEEQERATLLHLQARAMASRLGVGRSACMHARGNMRALRKAWWRSCARPGSRAPIPSRNNVLPPSANAQNPKTLLPRSQNAVAVMHAAGLVSADLKPENVLLRAPPAAQTPGSCPEVALCDLGSAFSETETDTAKLSFEMQTLPYRAPEVIYRPSLVSSPLQLPSCPCHLFLSCP